MAGRRGQRAGNAKPPAIHLIDGSFRPDRHGDEKTAREEVAKDSAGPVPDPPAWLGGTALEEWARLGPRLHKTGRLADADVAAFASYCHAWGELVDAELAIKATLKVARAVLKAGGYSRAERAVARIVVASGGRLCAGTNGALVRNPASVEVAVASRRIREFAVEFGLTPASRARVLGSTPPKPGQAGYPREIVG